MQTKNHKSAYTIPCSSDFRDAIENLAARRGVNVADLARSILLTVPYDDVRTAPDPGEPQPGDREERILKSGASAGRVWRRKPRLQVRMPQGYDPVMVRRALGLALSIDRGELAIALERLSRVAETDTQQQDVEHEMDRLRGLVTNLSFEPLSAGVRTRGEALHVLGFPPTTRPDKDTLRSRFRTLASIHHPDNEFGNHLRMSQLNTAMEILSRPYF